MAIDLVAKIETLKRQGMPDVAILQRLTLEGHRSEDVTEHLRRITVAPVPVSIRQRSIRPLLGIIALGVLVVAVVATVYFLRPAPPVYSISLQSGEASSSLVYGSWPALSDPQFYADVRNRFIDQKASFITADLSAMELVVYMGGEPALTVPILAKGREGSWWETPVGLYEVTSRKENHFSSFGKVYQPYSMGFQGNFFIHGWPYYPDGTEVAKTYSGGCIRLSTADARKVYELVKVGMPVFVYEVEEQKEKFTYQYKAPTVPATAYVVADLEDGTVLAGDNANIQLPIASITKLMTALVAVEYINIEKNLSVQQRAKVGTMVPRLSVGKEVVVRDLLAVMLTESSNEAAEVIASAVGRDYFVDLMNKKAVAIGLQHTTFIDPSGLGVGNSSTAEDMFTLIKYLNENRRFILEMTMGNFSESIYGPVVFKQLANYNKVPGVKNSFYGGKVGETNAAKETYAGIFGFTMGAIERKVVVVVLGSDNSHSSVAALLQHLNAFYMPAPPIPPVAI